MKNHHAVTLGKKGGKIGGRSRSPAKIGAARKNGAKGGRPKGGQQMKNKTPKPRVMWANFYPLAGIGSTPRIHPTLLQAKVTAAGCAKPVRVAVIPLDDVEAIVERASMACGFGVGNTRVALTAAGIPCKRKARK